MATDKKVGVTVMEGLKKIRCANCGASGTGHFCGECGAPQTVSSNTYLLFAESFFKFSEIKRYIIQYCKILVSPTRGTRRTFEAGHLNDGIRFLEYSVGLYTLALGVSGFTLFTGNELIKTVAQTLWLFVTYSISYTVYYLVMRNKGTKRRTSREFLLFSCVTAGFTFPLAAVQFFGTPGSVLGLILAIPLTVYMVRSWKYFWGASGSRVFWSLCGCFTVGSLAGLLVIVPVWLAFGPPAS